MAVHTRGNGSTYFASLATAGKMHADVASALDTELNAYTSTVNAVDNANIAATPKIAGSKVDFSSAGFLLLTGGTMTGEIVHSFDGTWRTMRASGDAQNREYRGSDGALWGISHNTEWNGSSWDGRDVTGICAVMKMESDGLHYYHAVSDSSGVVPSWTEIFHVNTSKEIAIGTMKHKVGSFTRDISLATGNQVITGVGFQPSAILFFATVGTTNKATWGMDDASNGECIRTDDVAIADTFTYSTNSILVIQSGGGEYSGTIDTFDADGFTIDWVKTGTISGTLTIKYLAFR